MTVIGIILAVQFIALATYLLLNRYHPQTVLLLCGLCMMGIAVILGFETSDLQSGTGFIFFDLFQKLVEVMSERVADVGLMIMAVGGYVAYMKKIGASDALIYISMHSLSVCRKYPQFASILIIPVGQLLFVCIPSATGLGLLLATSVFPVLVSWGVSRLSAVSVVTACTVFDMGPASSNTARAAAIVGKSNMAYFTAEQLPVSIPLTLLLMALYYFVNRYFDRKEAGQTIVPKMKEWKSDTPLIYALLPLLPVILLLLFSPFLHLFSDYPIVPDTTTAVFISLFVALICEWIRSRRTQNVFASLKFFWTGMGKMFTRVVTLLVAAEIFSSGLIYLDLINGLSELSQNLGLGSVGIGVIMATVIFATTILMGSGSASFYSFGSQMPQIAASFQVHATDIILPMQFASGLGRAVSPVSGVVVALSEIAGVLPLQLAKRNFIPLTAVFICMLLYKYVLQI